MTTFVVEVPDSKSEQIYNYLINIPNVKINKKLIPDSKSFDNYEELLKEGYLASNLKDNELMNDFLISDFSL